MNCFDCSALGRAVPAVGVCADCGSGVCPDHAQVAPRWLTRTLLIDRVEVVEPPARLLRCVVCEVAREAAGARRTAAS